MRKHRSHPRAGLHWSQHRLNVRLRHLAAKERLAQGCLDVAQAGGSQSGDALG